MEDTRSTQVEWGTPHTASFSTTESHPPSTSPPEAGPSGSGQHQSSGQHYYPPSSHSHTDFILYGLAGEEHYADGHPPQEQIFGQPFQLGSSPDIQQQQLLFPQNGETPTQLEQYGNGTPPLQYQPQTTSYPQVDDAGSIAQWRDSPPWSHVPAAEGRVDPQTEVETPYPADRNYPDKMQGDLDELVRGTSTGSDENDGNKKRRRSKKGKKRRRHRSGSRGRERDKRGRGGGGGNGHGIRV